MHCYRGGTRQKLGRMQPENKSTMGFYSKKHSREEQCEKIMKALVEREVKLSSGHVLQEISAKEMRMRCLQKKRGVCTHSTGRLPCTKQKQERQEGTHRE